MKIENGKFVRTSESDLGVVVGDKIVYQKGTFDSLSIFNKDGDYKWYSIEAIYDANCFYSCTEDKIIWTPKKPILDDKEKEYLTAVIKPFRDKIMSITKYNEEENELIDIEHRDDFFQLPYFKKGTMYKGMKVGRHYTLEELGL